MTETSESHVEAAPKGNVLADLLEDLIHEVELGRAALHASEYLQDGTIPDPSARASLRRIDAILVPARAAARAARAEAAHPELAAIAASRDTYTLPIDPKTGHAYPVLSAHAWAYLPREGKALYAWDVPTQRYVLRDTFPAP